MAEKCVVKGVSFEYCPLREGKCMYRRLDGKCKYREDYTVKGFCRALHLERPTSAELEEIKNRLLEKLKK